MSDKLLTEVCTPMIFRGEPVAVQLSYVDKADNCWHVSIAGYHQGRIQNNGGAWRDVDKKFEPDELKWFGHRIELRLAEDKWKSIYIT